MSKYLILAFFLLNLTTSFYPENFLPYYIFNIGKEFKHHKNYLRLTTVDSITFTPSQEISFRLFYEASKHKRSKIKGYVNAKVNFI
jgi:hypothetical protein